MRPILYNANETAFETYGLGEIDATKAQVTRERNGNYTLYIEYPASGPLAGTFKNDMRIKSDAGLRTKNQTFFISRILKDSTGILKVYAKHISHLTEKMAIRNNTNATGTAQAALAIWALNALGGIRFDTWSDIDLTSKTSWNIADFKTARDALGGVSGSILDVWGGEYEFDNTVIRLHKQLGRRSPIVLEYGRNILRAEDDQDIDGAYTSVYPYATYTPENQGNGDGGSTSQQITVELPEKYVDGPYIGLYNERRVLIVDFSSNFKDKEVPTIDKLRRLAKEYAINNRLGLPKINTKIEYVDLSKTLDYKLTQILEEAELCDIVPVYYPQIGLTSEDAKLTTIVYDVLLEQNDSVEVGVIGDGFKSSMTSNLSGKIDDLVSNQQRLVNTLPDYLLNAQGNKVWYSRPDNNEHKVGDIWFEKNGLYDRMYVWNGSQWEKRIDTEDIDKVKKEVDKQISDAQSSTNQAIAQANAKAEEALKKAGTLPDTSKLSDQIKQQILSSPDLQNKVTEEVRNVDGDIVYGKIRSKLLTQFVDKGELESIDRVQNDQGRDLLNLSKQIATQTLEFNKLTESNKLYERIIGTSETDAPDRLSRLVMSSDIFQTEVGKYVTDDNNLIVNSMTMSTNTLVGNNNPNASVSVNDGIFTIKTQGLTGYNWTGFTLPIYVKKVYHGETYTLGFKYRIREYPDVSFAFNIKNHGLNKTLTWSNIGENRPALNEWQEFQKTFTMQEDFIFGEDKNYPFYIFLAKNGWIEFKEPILVRGSNTGPYKPSQFDDAFAETRSLESRLDSKVNEVSGATAEAKQLAVGAQARADQATARSQYASEKAEDAQAKAIQVAEQARLAQQSAEATRTQVTQLAGSWSVKNLNSAGDVLGQLNLNPDGSVRINEGLLSVGEKTIIKDGVIKKSMIGEAQIGTAHISEIDASKARLINVSAKNIVSDGLTANIIKGGKLSSLNGVTDFDLQTGWIDMNNANVGIRNQFRNKPLQYLVFGEGKINEKDASYTALMSNSWKRVAMDDGSAGIQIWNANDNTTAVNIYGDLVEFMYNAHDKKSIAIDTVKNEISGLDDILLRNRSLVTWFNSIDSNFKAIANWFNQNNLGAPGLYRLNM
jgi:phage minor structural protein, N-terminal domain protein|nr:MAG TPA: tail protein [Caudoviricetes sp.]